MKTYVRRPPWDTFFMVGIYFQGSSLSLNIRQTAHFSIYLTHLKMRIQQMIQQMNCNST